MTHDALEWNKVCNSTKLTIFCRKAQEDFSDEGTAHTHTYTFNPKRRLFRSFLYIQFMKECLFSAVARMYSVFFFSIYECVCDGCMHACMQSSVCKSMFAGMTTIYILCVYKVQSIYGKTRVRGRNHESKRVCTYLSVLILCFHIHSSWNQHMYWHFWSN